MPKMFFTYSVKDPSTWSGVKERHGSVENAVIHFVEKSTGYLITARYKKYSSQKYTK